MRRLSRNDLEAISRRVLRAYWKRPDAQQNPDRVYPEILLTQVLGLKIDYRHLSEDGTTIGMTSFDTFGIELYDSIPGELYPFDGKTVLVERDLLNPEYEGRRNFTLMHEGDHHILNLLFPGEYSGGVSTRRVLKHRIAGAAPKYGSDEYWEEWQMDALASPLLMPADLVRKHLKDYGFPNGIDRLNRLAHHGGYDAFVEISKKMGVSKQALAYRMERLGLLRENDLKNPFVIMEIWKDDDEDV